MARPPFGNNIQAPTSLRDEDAIMDRINQNINSAGVKSGMTKRVGYTNDGHQVEVKNMPEDSRKGPL